MDTSKNYHREYMRKYRAGKETAKNNGLNHLISELDWKEIPGFPGYKASKCGQILSEKRVLTRSNGRLHTVPAKVLKQSKDGKGYFQVGIYLNKKKISTSVHKLIFLAWNGERPLGMFIDHVDGNKINNHADNLQLLKPSENVLKGWEDEKLKSYKQGQLDLLKELHDKILLHGAPALISTISIKLQELS